MAEIENNHLIHPVNPVILSIFFIAFGHIFGKMHFPKPVPVNLPPDKTDRINKINWMLTPKCLA